jgi:uncharacterized protein GlcG (DUF336 family)
MRRLPVLLLAGTLTGMLAGCGGGGSGGNGGPSIATAGCSGGCAAATPSALTVAEVNRILSQAVQEAQARAAPGTIAVADRSGNVLAVFQMTGAASTFTISGGRGVVGGLEGLNIVPAQYAAISKAVTGAYLSSEGNAFSTRTASQIVQENFNPGENGSPGGPLFGVQFSSLSCSDVVAATGSTVGPKPSPLGLAADPGGLPLYKNGIVVGGIGVIADGIYGLDLNITDIDQNPDELIAVAGARGFDAPVDRRADHITADGRTFRYVDSEALVSNPAAAPAAPPAGAGALLAVPAYKPVADVTAGVAFSTNASGFRLDTSTPAFAGLNAYVLDNGAGVNRFPPIAGTDGLLTQAEVTRILAEAMKVANRARAQIRLPLGLPAQVSISVVDTNAALLGLIRTPDAPVFGTDVAVQKARSALLFSQANAAVLAQRARATGLPRAPAGKADAAHQHLRRQHAGADSRRVDQRDRLQQSRDRQSCAPLPARRHQRQRAGSVVEGIRGVEPFFRRPPTGSRLRKDRRQHCGRHQHRPVQSRAGGCQWHPDLSRRRAHLSWRQTDRRDRHFRRRHRPG